MVLGLAILGLLYVVNTWRIRATVDLPKARQEISELRQTAETKEKQDKINRDIGDKHAQAEQVINDPSRKLPGFVCKSSKVLPTVPSSPTGTAPAATDRVDGLHGVDPERDVSDGGTVYAKRCELLRSEVIFWQDWYNEQARVYELQRKVVEGR